MTQQMPNELTYEQRVKKVEQGLDTMKKMLSKDYQDFANSQDKLDLIKAADNKDSVVSCSCSLGEFELSLGTLESLISAQITSKRNKLETTLEDMQEFLDVYFKD